MADEPLNADDYAALRGMLVSDDKDQRKQGMTLASKLTGAEAVQFFDYQKAANKGKGEMGRQDATLAGLPVELALVGGSTVGKLASAVSGIARVLPEKAIRATAAAGDVVSPDVIGMVSPRAGRAVEVAQRVRSAMSKPQSPSAPVEPPVAPVEAPPVAPVTVSASPQRLLNDLGIAARRAGVELTAADDADVLMRISKGADPTQAIADVIAAKPPTDPAAAFAAKYGLPSDAERTFPPNKAGLQTKPGYQVGRPK